MSNASDTQVLIAGGGPIGLTAAIELARQGIACRIVDPLVEPRQYAKAVGVQPRTLEVFEGMGVLRHILDAAVLMRGQIVYVNGERSPIVAGAAGARAPDAMGLTRDAVTGPLRLFELLGRREHTTLLYAPDGPVDIATFGRAAKGAVSAAHGRMDVYLIAAPGAEVAATELPLIRDTAGDFARAYAPAGPSAYVVRPDGYLGLAAAGVDPAQLVAHLGATFARLEGDVTG
jgi:hypothetical protein